ncbi:MAG TPA: hypothetical protein IAB67_04925, partial [Candidatus Ventrousia excrementavium]|nr:hypothetical protein [Candidatus Ventrousia excrementavium]
PAGYSFSLLAMLEFIEPRGTLVCAVNGPLEKEILSIASEGFTDILVKTRANAGLLSQVAPSTAGYQIPETGTAYYLCRNGACRPPVYDLESLRTLMQQT